MIELNNVGKIFGKQRAVENLTLSVPRGEIYGLLGHNGAGKSTAIGMMLGQVWPTEGEIRLFGFDVATQRQRALQKVGAIFETPVFYDYLSGRRNLEILSSFTARTPRRRIEEVIHWVGLAGREQSEVKTYSHGMRARLALAQALLPQPELLILDEPSDGLDPEGIHEMRETILRLRQEMGLTILLSSHLLNEVEQLCTRIAVMNKGRKVFEGPLASIQEAQSWVSLRVDDFAAAAKVLRQENLMVDERDGTLIALAKNTETDEVVRCLVKNDIAVYEIARHEQNLEGFYLSLMKTDRAQAGAGQKNHRRLRAKGHKTRILIMFFLQLRNELWKLFGKKRTYIGSVMFLLAQSIIILIMEFGQGPYRELTADIERAGHSADHFMSNLTIATMTLTPIAYFLLPLYVALVGGDLVAKEAEDGTLRMILCRPISRLRLLMLKWVAGGIFSLVLTLTFGLFGAVFASVFFPSGGLFVFLPLERMISAFDGAAAWERFAAVHLVMTAEAVSLMTLAFMFSCFNIKPAAATILAISFFFISMILHDMPYFHDLREWFLVHHLYVWSNFFRQHIPWWKVGESMSILAGYNLTFLIIGAAVFQTRDIKS